MEAWFGDLIPGIHDDVLLEAPVVQRWTACLKVDDREEHFSNSKRNTF